MTELLSKSFEFVKQHSALAAFVAGVSVEVVNVAAFESNQYVAIGGMALFGVAAFANVFGYVEGNVSDFEDYSQRILLNPGQKPPKS